METKKNVQPQDIQQKHIPVLIEYANYVAQILIDRRCLYENAEGLRVFVKKYINDRTERTQFMHAVLGDTTDHAQSLTYKVLLKQLIETNLGSNYNIELVSYHDEDTSPIELADDTEIVNRGLKIEIQNLVVAQ